MLSAIAVDARSLAATRITLAILVLFFALALSTSSPTPSPYPITTSSCSPSRAHAWSGKRPTSRRSSSCTRRPPRSPSATARASPRWRRGTWWTSRYATVIAYITGLSPFFLLLLAFLPCAQWDRRSARRGRPHRHRLARHGGARLQLCGSTSTRAAASCSIGGAWALGAPVPALEPMRTPRVGRAVRASSARSCGRSRHPRVGQVLVPSSRCSPPRRAPAMQAACAATMVGCTPASGSA